jgi:hypothetical protein
MSIGKYRWKCPHKECNAESRKIQGYGRAKRHGRKHMKLKHNEDKDPILVKIE